MPAPVYTALDYLAQTQRLLPRGRVWHRGFGTLQAQYLLTLMPTVVRLNERAANLLVDAFPCGNPYELLPEWEASLGLPDACTGPLPTLQQRQAAVCAKFIHRGGQSIAYYESVAEALGYAIRVETYQPFRVNINRVTQPLYAEAWANTFKVIGPLVTVTYFRSGISTVGEPLAAWGNELLECTIRALAPAHTRVIFAYPTESQWDQHRSLWDVDQSQWDYREPTKAEPAGWLRLKIPAALQRAFFDRARLEKLRPDKLFAALWERFTQ